MPFRLPLTTMAVRRSPPASPHCALCPTWPFMKGDRGPVSRTPSRLLASKDVATAAHLLPYCSRRAVHLPPWPSIAAHLLPPIASSVQPWPFMKGDHGPVSHTPSRLLASKDVATAAHLLPHCFHQAAHLAEWANVGQDTHWQDHHHHTGEPGHLQPLSSTTATSTTTA